MILHSISTWPSIIDLPNYLQCSIQQTLRLFGEYIFSNFKATLLKRDLSYEFCEIFKNTYFVKHLQTASSVYCHTNFNLEKSLLVHDWLLIHFIQLCQSIKTVEMLLIHLWIPNKFIDFHLLTVKYPARFLYRCTGISIQILTPKKSRSTLFYTDIFITRLHFFILTLNKS